jgi:ABC-2 type transport system permease protein
MALLIDSPVIPATQQFRAITYLRWRLFANSFRRSGGVGEFIASIIIYPIAFCLLLGPTLGAGFGTYFAIRYNHLTAISAIFWVITGLQVIVSINLSPQGLSFDPESLIRYPVSFPRYLLIRLFLGLLAPSTIVGTCCLLAAAVGTTVARPDLGPIAFTAAIVLAIANLLFIRMAFAWIDRWTATRRTRELFTGIIILLSVGIQWLNFTFNPGFARHGDHAAQTAKLNALRHFYHTAQSLLSHFPAGLAGDSIVDIAQHKSLYAAINLIGTILFAAFFLAIFAWRMHVEYRGENISDSANSTQKSVPHPRVARVGSAATLASTTATSSFSPSPVLTVCFYKEFLYIRRNSTQFFALLVPLAMVFLFAGKIGAVGKTFADWTFPIAVIYSTLGVAALAYNSLGADAAGIQFYFLAPIRFRTIVLAKNSFLFSLVMAQTILIYFVLCFIATPPTLLITFTTLLWLAFAILSNVTLGNIRSILAPKKIDPTKMARKQTSQLSALISVLLVFVLGAVGYGVMALGKFLALPWLPVAIFAALAVGALALYLAGLQNLDNLVQAHRETIIEELCKAD